ncbi:MAG TPA: GFA family protein [Candidatus Binatia bacterium]
MVELPLTGGCQCGTLRYEIRRTPLVAYNCHCTNCQRIGGGAFSTPLVVLEDGFAFTQGEPRTFEWTSDVGTRRFGWFCGDCGCRIAHGAIPSSGILSVRSGTLDDPSWVEPVGDIWTRSARAWALWGDRIRIEKQPTDYGPFLERFQRQGRFGS